MESIIEAKRLPVSPSLLQSIQANASQRLKDAQSVVCTPESLLPVKSERAEAQKEYDALEEWRKAIKEWVMAEYKRFEAAYKAATKDHVDALTLYSSKIKQTESAIKQECEDGLRDYFAELCAVRHLDWLVYERAGIKVDMASAKAKTPKKLREQLASFVTQVGDSVDRIVELDDAEEIMVEFQRTLDAADAICAVQERHRRIDEERAAREARNGVLEQEAEAVRRVEALAPPVVMNPPKTVKCTFTVYTTMDKLKGLKEFLNMEGIQYE